MLKALLIGIAVAVLLDAAAFRGTYREEVASASVKLVHTVATQDWDLTHP